MRDGKNHGRLLWHNDGSHFPGRHIKHWGCVHVAPEHFRDSRRGGMSTELLVNMFYDTPYISFTKSSDANTSGSSWECFKRPSLCIVLQGKMKTTNQNMASSCRRPKRIVSYIEWNRQSASLVTGSNSVASSSPPPTLVCPDTLEYLCGDLPSKNLLLFSHPRANHRNCITLK